MTSILYDDAVIITQHLHSQLVLDIDHVINSLVDPPISEEWDEFGRVDNPYINDSMIQVVVTHACENARRWETPQDRGRFYHFLAAEIAIQLVEYRDNILLSGEPPSHQMASLKKTGGPAADWTFLQVCGLYTAVRIIFRAYETPLRVDSRPDLVGAFGAHLDRVAKGENPPVKDLADILQVLARAHDVAEVRDDVAVQDDVADVQEDDVADVQDDVADVHDEVADAQHEGLDATTALQDDADEKTGKPSPDVGGAPTAYPPGGEKASKKRTGSVWAAVVLGAVVVLVAVTGGGWLWGHSTAQAPAPTQPVPDSPGPQRPPFPRDALAEVGMPLRPNVLLRLTGVSDGAQRWNSQSVSGSAPALPVPLDITPLAGDDPGLHKVIRVTLDLQLRDPGISADPGLLISASGDYPLAFKDGLDQNGERYATTLATPEQPVAKDTHPLTSSGDDTPLSLEGDGVWTFTFYVDLGDPAMYQCGYHVRSITAFAEFDPKYSASVPPNSKIVDTLPVALLRTC